MITGPARLLRLLSSLLLVALTPRGTDSATRGSKQYTGSNTVGIEQTLALMRQWQSSYGLNNSLPPSSVSLPRQVPLPPHLQDCASLTRLRRRLESRGTNGEPPAWTKGSDGCPPQPPWVRGSDAANLALTRTVQADIWRHQFPASCRGKRLLLTAWQRPNYFGVGAQLHVMSAALSLAMTYDRVLVPDPLSYQRASHDGCKRIGKDSSLECYFFPLVSRECEEEAVAAREGKRGEILQAAAWGGFHKTMSSDAPFVHLAMGHQPMRMEARVVSKWGNPHLDRPSTIEINGTTSSLSADLLKVQWWRAQTTRFFLRWPSPYLCHVTNRLRHSSFAPLLAAHLSSSLHQQQALLNAMREGDAIVTSAGTGVTTSDQAEEAEQLERWSLDPESGLESNVWPWERYSGGAMPYANNTTNETYQIVGPSGERNESWELGGEDMYKAVAEVSREAYMPRPMVGMHVRQGDKVKESKVFSLAAHIFLLLRLKRKEPLLRFVWLSSETQAVIDNSTMYPGWTFFSSSEPRATRAVDSFIYDKAVGLEEITGEVFANMLVQSECDYFVGTLASNRVRLVNELRSTNGRLFSGFLALNIAEW